ncbi:viroplasmin family protein [Caldisalinibacter kiritimatiensis]|uniref:Ribonuclease H n=1 Tax=Caldisalinibacter kiritimatiensis TaxID=1304284 RepID=R1CTK6_9FIRM|nr:ribonuclease H family protein [Caldisalinibacter kiritimatiensis]EOD00004.1 Ribonuclease HI-related protein [Caldisalinibacter kiritimatiensis]
MVKNKVYAVRKGRKTGIFKTWKECKDAVIGYSGAQYKSFDKVEDARLYLKNINHNLHKDISQLDNNEMIAYVDGSYDINTKFYSYGVIIFYKGEKQELYGRAQDKKLVNMRNVAGEITGAKVAINYAIKNKAKILYLYYDYEGIEKWATGSWKTNKEATKEYKKFYNSISGKLQVIFNKVKAHSGNIYNEEADRLAKKALLENLSVEHGKKYDSIHLVESKVYKTNLIPIFNIRTSEGKEFNTKKLVDKFKQEWRNENLKIKDIENLNIVLDCKELKAIFIVKTKQEAKIVEIEIN